MGAASFSRTRFVLPPFLRGMVAYLGLPHCQTPAAFWHVLPAEPSGARIDAPVGPTERSRLDIEDCCAGMQYWARSLFNPLDHPLGTARLKSAPGCGGYFEEILNFAEKGTYTPDCSQLVGASIFERLTEAEMAEMFDCDGDQATVKSWLREGITWHLRDAADPELMRILGPQDMVVASNFLCHMAQADAEKCLRNVARLVSPGGYLFVSGVDLDIRTKVALDLGWEPVPELIKEIHNGDPSVRADWPWQWWGLEPLNRRRHDWRTRYAVSFRIVSSQLQ